MCSINEKDVIHFQIVELILKTLRDGDENTHHPDELFQKAASSNCGQATWCISLYIALIF